MTLWSGRFASGPDETLWRFTTDTSDRRLLVDDVTGSLAHVAMLGEVGLLDVDAVARIKEGLEHVLDEVPIARPELLRAVAIRHVDDAVLMIDFTDGQNRIDPSPCGEDVDLGCG